MINFKNYDDCIKTMCHMEPTMKYNELLEKWHSCFSFYLKSRKVGYTQKTIDDLFYNFEMDNWEAMHKENTEYAKYSKKKLIDEFCGECHYISDRMSYDRLFRAHWLFRQAFVKQLNKNNLTSSKNYDIIQLLNC